MTTKTDRKVEELKTTLEVNEEIDAIKGMNYRLSHAIRDGAMVTEKGPAGWGDGDTACAMHAAVIAGRARGYDI